MRKTAFALLITLMMSCCAVAADVYQTGRVVKWENSTYPDDHKARVWIVYQVQGENMLYSIARHKETKARMRPGDVIQFRAKGSQMTVFNAQGKKEQYQIVGQSQAPPQ